MKNVKIKLRIYFAILTTITIVTTSVLFAIYLYSNVRNLLGKYNSSMESMVTSLTSALSQVITEDIKKNNFSSSKNLINLLIRDERVKYIYLRNIDTGKFVIGEEKEFIKDTEQQPNLKQFKKQYTPEDPKYTLYAGVPIEIFNSDVYEGFSLMIVKLLLTFLLLGAIVSYLMANVVSEPLKKLSDAARQITDGNFDIKIEESSFDEINDLVFSYNEMTTQLNELYSSLELKVQERTIALEAANYKLKETQAMMVHSEKMRSLGELVAGIAHEINNPVNFIHGNIMILQNYADDLLSVIDLYSELDDNLPEDFKTKVLKLKKDIDIDFLRGDIKDLIKSCIEGTQ